MKQCPKCGSREIGGPTYERVQMPKVCVSYVGFAVVERLRSTCKACGYWEDKPCLDAAEGTK